MTLCLADVDRSRQLAKALVEHETLDAEEVQKVIRGEPIRDIDEVIKEDLSRLNQDITS